MKKKLLSLLFIMSISLAVVACGDESKKEELTTLVDGEVTESVEQVSTHDDLENIEGALFSCLKSKA